MFHALPPSAIGEAKRQLGLQSRLPPPHATIAGLMDLGGGVAFRIVSDDLDLIRADLAEHFHGMLGAPDAVGWRPHVTIQNKVKRSEARDLLNQLDQQFQPRPLGIVALSLHRYLGGPWEAVARYPFRGVR